MIGQTCPTCGYIHAGTDVRAVSRFSPRMGYRAAHPDAPIRATREEADADMCAWRVGGGK